MKTPDFWFGLAITLSGMAIMYWAITHRDAPPQIAFPKPDLATGAMMAEAKEKEMRDNGLWSKYDTFWTIEGPFLFEKEGDRLVAKLYVNE